MVRKTDKRKLIIAASILGVLLVAIVTVAIIRAATSNKSDPYVMRDESSQTSSTSDETVSTPDSTEESSSTKPNDTTDSEAGNSAPVDPSTVSTVDIAPMNITVSYVKGVGGFEYEVLRTPNGSQYVEFSSAELVGTKCTNDKGVFASILADPSSNEGSTITKTATVDGTKYGLSLAATNCTSDAAKLQKYQQSFNDAFSLLKKTN